MLGQSMRLGKRVSCYRPVLPSAPATGKRGIRSLYRAAAEKSRRYQKGIKEMQYVRVVAEPTKDNPNEPPIYVDAIVDAQLE
jgi:hypothetical protein